MSKLTYQDKTFLQELAEIPEINKVTDNNMNSIKKAVNENGQYVSATESNGEFTCTLEGSISQNDIVHILFDTNSTATPASLSVDGGNTFLNILDASGNSINASELSGQSISVKNAGSHFEVETLNSYSSSKAKSYSANYVNGLNTYSTTETKIGKWIDGKPIYRKVIKVTSIDSSSNNYDVTISISNLNEIVNIGGTIKMTGTNTYKPVTTIFTDNSNAISSIFSFSVYAITNSYISLSYGNWWKTIFDKAYIILEYTKTTD